MIKVTAVSKALIGPRDQIIRSGSRHFGHYVNVRMRLFLLVLLRSKCVAIGSCVLPIILDDIRLCDRRYDPFRVPRSR